MFDVNPAPSPSWLSRSAPGLVVIGGVLLFLGGEVVDWRWNASLRQARCTVLSAKTEGRIQTKTEQDQEGRAQATAEYVEETTVELQVDGGGPRLTVQEPGGSSGFPVGQVRDCWVAAEQVYLHPESQRRRRRWSHVTWSGIVVAAGLVWLWQRRSSSAS